MPQSETQIQQIEAVDYDFEMTGLTGAVTIPAEGSAVLVNFFNHVDHVPDKDLKDALYNIRTQFIVAYEEE